MNPIREYPALIAELERRRGLDVLARFTRIPLERLQALQGGHAPITPAEEWALFGFCETQGLFGLLAQYGVAPPTYNRHGDFEFGSRPEGEGVPVPSHGPATLTTDLLGHRVDFPLGIPASALATNHQWARFYLDRGFCIITHKTVRARPRRAHPRPHWALVKAAAGRWSYPFTDAQVTAAMDTWPEGLHQFSMVNSMGVPSLEPRDWQAEIEKDLSVLKAGTALIVSVMGTPEEADTLEDLKRDFATAAAMAKEAGAQIIEANYSCPNTRGSVEDVYTNPVLAAAISEAVRRAIGPDMPFLIKTGYLPQRQLADLVGANAQWVNGITAINTIRARVTDDAGNQFFPGPGRAGAGVSGSLIKPFAREMVGNLVRLKRDIKPDLAILGVGGVTTAEDVEEFLELGATAVLSCTGAWVNPNLAVEARLAHAGAGRGAGQEQLRPR